MKREGTQGAVHDAKPARHLLGWLLRRTGYSGICLPPFGIYLLPERLSDPALIAHERCHWRQAERMGTVRWALTYLWYNLRFGYRDNPLEREAREAGRRTKASPGGGRSNA